MLEQGHATRSLGLWRLSALVTGNMMGSGMFMLPASLAIYGTIGVVAWVVTAMGAIVLASVFGRLSRIVDGVGGPYAFSQAAYGDFVGFQVAYCYWIAVWVGNSALLVAAVAALSVFFPVIGHDPALALGISLAILWVITLINMVGVREAGVVQFVMTIAKLLPILFLAVLGFVHLKPSYLAQFNVSGLSNWQAFSACVTLTLWSFIGFESATVPRDHAINPERDIPRATVLGTALAGVVYILVTVAIMGVVPMGALSKSAAPFAVAAQALVGPWGAYLVAAVAAIACTGALNGCVLMQGQISMAVARRGLFPKIFAKQNRDGTPAIGIAIGSVGISVLLIMRYGVSLVDQFTYIISLAVLASLIPYIYSAMAEIAILLKNNQRQSWLVLKWPATLGAMAFIYAFWAVIGAGQGVVYDGMLLFLSSLPAYLYMLWARDHRKSVHEDKCINI